MIGSHKFNIIRDGGRWFKSRIIELILNYKPEIIQSLLPDFQIVSLGASDSYIRSIIGYNGYIGIFPRGRHLASPSEAIRHFQGIRYQGMGKGALAGYEIPVPFAKFLSEVEIGMLDKLYPIFGHPVFDFIGFKAIPEESYNHTVDLSKCYQYINKPIWQIGEDVISFTEKRHEFGGQYRNAIKMLIKEVEERLGIKVALLEKAVIELKSSSKGIIALSSKQKKLIRELIINGFKFYIILAQFKSDWVVEFTLYRSS